MMGRALIPGFLFAVLVVFFWQGLSLSPGTLPSPLIGKPAPEFELPLLQTPNETLGSKALTGRPYLLNVWGSWCVGCRHEHDALLEIAATGLLPIYGLNWKDQREDALQWLRQLGNPYQANMVDQEGDVAIDWGVYGAPETFLVDAEGMVRHKHVGPLTLDIWRDDFMPHILPLLTPQ